MIFRLKDLASTFICKNFRYKVTKDDEEKKKKKQNVELKTQKAIDDTGKVVNEFKQPAPPSYEEAMKDVKKVEKLWDFKLLFI